MLNYVNLMGRLTQEPELRATQIGKSVAKFTIAVERDYVKNDTKETDFINCLSWGKTAEFIHNYFRKGDMVLVAGRIEVSSYEKDGKKVYRTDVNVDRVYFAGGKKDTTQIGETNEMGTVVDDEHLPF